MTDSGMALVIAQISDVHIGGHVGSAERLTLAIDAINSMTASPDLVLLTGDLTQTGAAQEWDELLGRLAPLRVRWEAIAGNHDRGIADIAGHRAVDLGRLRLALLDSSDDTFDADDAAWLEAELAAHADRPTVIAIHHPPFDTGIWWMDCVGLNGKELFEAVVRRHPHVIKVLSGHVHRPIQTHWGTCALWVGPSTSVSVAADLDPSHEPAETSEGPAISLHAFTGSTIVTHVVPIGNAAARTTIAPDFIASVRTIQKARADARSRRS